MEALRDFAEKDMIEQIVVLKEIRERKLVEAVPALMDLYATPDGVVKNPIYRVVDF